MDFMAAAFSTLITVFVLALFAAGVMKLFQIHSVLLEIKDALARRPVSPVPSVPPAAVPLALTQSGEEMLRALDAQMRWETDAAPAPDRQEPR
jgi:hypothetical protein